MPARKRRNRSLIWIAIGAAVTVGVALLLVALPWDRPPGRSLKVTVDADGRAIPRAQPALEVLVEGGERQSSSVAAVTVDGVSLTAPVEVGRGDRRSVDLPLTDEGRRVFGTCAVGVEVELRISDGGARQTVPLPLERDPIRCAPLQWKPPELENPEEVLVTDDTAIVRLDPDRDYRLRLPDHKRIGGLQVYGGRNVVLIGGHITVPESASTDQEHKALSFGDQTGVVHVEGVLIDASAGGPSDGVSIRAPEAVLQLQNSRIVGLRGTTDGVHADVVQPWGGLKELRIDRLSGSSHFQGLQIPEDRGPIERADLRSVDLSALPEIDGGGHMLWLTHDECDSYAVRLARVYVMPRDDRTLATTVWPESSREQECAAKEEEGSVSWPDLPVQGVVDEGPPPGGPFVPPLVPGAEYRSPGYATGP